MYGAIHMTVKVKRFPFRDIVISAGSRVFTRGRQTVAFPPFAAVSPIGFTGGRFRVKSVWGGRRDCKDVRDTDRTRASMSAKNQGLALIPICIGL